MYVPKHFAVEDLAAILEFIRREPFGILVSTVDGAPYGTHVPFIILDEEPLRLGLHVAKANPHWKALQDAQVMAIFQGPHALVSASWYGDPRHSVPTWNYSAVHCNGRATLTDARGTRSILRSIASTLDPNWRMEDADPGYIEQMEKGVVGIEIDVERITAAFKLSQNRTPDDVHGAAQALSESERPMEREVSAQMLARQTKNPA